MIERLETMLANGQDNALLRFSLGNAYLKTDPHKACEHLSRATELDPTYSAAWKLLGQAFAACNDDDAAVRTYERGIEVANDKGDMQAVREMTVFLKRLRKKSSAD